MRRCRQRRCIAKIDGTTSTEAGRFQRRRDDIHRDGTFSADGVTPSAKTARLQFLHDDVFFYGAPSRDAGRFIDN